MNRVGGAFEGVRFIVVILIATILSNLSLNHVDTAQILKDGAIHANEFTINVTSAAFMAWAVWALIQMYEAGRTWLLDLFAPAVLHSMMLLMQFAVVATNASVIGHNSNLSFVAVCLYLVMYVVAASIFFKSVFVPWAIRIYATTLKKYAALAEAKYYESLRDGSCRNKIGTKINDFKFENLCKITVDTVKSSTASVNDVVFSNLFDAHHSKYVLTLKGADSYFPSEQSFQDVLNGLPPKFTSSAYLFQIGFFWPMIAVFYATSRCMSKIRILKSGSRLLNSFADVELKVIDDDKNDRLFKKTLNEN